MCGFVWTFQKNFKQKQEKITTVGSAIYTFGITSAFDLKHTAILRMDRQLLPMGKNFLSVTDFSKVNNKNNNNKNNNNKYLYSAYTFQC